MTEYIEDKTLVINEERLLTLLCNHIRSDKTILTTIIAFNKDEVVYTNSYIDITHKCISTTLFRSGYKLLRYTPGCFISDIALVAVNIIDTLTFYDNNHIDEIICKTPVEDLSATDLKLPIIVIGETGYQPNLSKNNYSLAINKELTDGNYIKMSVWNKNN